ncbi:MAG: hypothetical protein ACLQOO_23755 [Terriglobia bacterium]
MASIVYSHFDPVFSQVATDDATLYIADSGRLGWGGRLNGSHEWVGDRHGYRYGKTEKINVGFNYHLPRPSSTSSGEPVLQTNGLLGRRLVLRRFVGYKIVPNFTNIYQKRAANGREQADKG